MHEPGELIDTVYFLEDAVASVVITMENGSTVEVGLIGRDGVVGLPAVLGNGRATNRTFIQLPGSGFSVKARFYVNWLSRPPNCAPCLQLAIQGYLARRLKPPHAIESMSSKSAWLAGC